MAPKGRLYVKQVRRRGGRLVLAGLILGTFGLVFGYVDACRHQERWSISSFLQDTPQIFANRTSHNELSSGRQQQHDHEGREAGLAHDIKQPQDNENCRVNKA